MNSKTIRKITIQPTTGISIDRYEAIFKTLINAVLRLKFFYFPSLIFLYTLVIQSTVIEHVLCNPC